MADRKTAIGVEKPKAIGVKPKAIGVEKPKAIGVKKDAKKSLVERLIERAKRLRNK